MNIKVEEINQIAAYIEECSDKPALTRDSLSDIKKILRAVMMRENKRRKKTSKEEFEIPKVLSRYC